jgi:hypothetical protein
MDGAVLKDESYAYAGVEAAEVGRHGGNGEVGAGDVRPRASVLDLGRIAVIIVGEV